MFVGHFALALAAKPAAPRTSLGTLFAATQLLDLAWPLLVLSGFEAVRVDHGATAFTPLDFERYPLSHSAALVAIWALLFGLGYLARTGYRAGAWTAGLLVASHWLLDFITHRPDLPVYPGGAKVGLGLWNSVPATLVVEGGIYAAGVWIYLSSTRPRDAAGRWGAASLLGFLALTYLANAFGPPPPSGQAVAVAALAMWLFVPWAAWVDRHRAPVRDEGLAGRPGAPSPG